MPVERREQVTCIGIVRVNGQPEELEGSSGRRQPPRGGTSRISREAYVRFCERLGVQSPGPTRRWETGRRSGVSARAHPRLYKIALVPPGRVTRDDSFGRVMKRASRFSGIGDFTSAWIWSRPLWRDPG